MDSRQFKNSRKLIRMQLTRCIILGAILSPATVSAQQLPAKVQPMGRLDENANARNSAPAIESSLNAMNSGFSQQAESSTPQPDCLCVRNAKKKRLFQRKCKLHPEVDLSMIPNPYEEIPLGLQLNETMSTQVRKYENTRQILYNYDFVDGSPDLNHAGKLKLAKISQQIFSNFAPIIVESTPRQPGLDLSRRLQLVHLISNQGLPIPAERIIVSDMLNKAMTGPDAIILYNNSLRSLSQGASDAGSQGMAGGGIGGLNGSGLLPNTQSTQSDGGY